MRVVADFVVPHSISLLQVQCPLQPAQHTGIHLDRPDTAPPPLEGSIYLCTQPHTHTVMLLIHSN